MLAADRDALVCDLAETYGVFDLRALPVATLATLAAGLRDDARIRQRLAGTRASQDTLLLARAVDALDLLVWSKTKAARHGRGRPESIAQLLATPEKAKKDGKDDVMVFATPEEFRAAWEGGKNGRN